MVGPISPSSRAKARYVFRWAEPQALPVTVVAGADHFFSGRLSVLARAVSANLKDIPADSGLPR